MGAVMPPPETALSAGGQSRRAMKTILINGSHPEILVRFRAPLIRDLAARGYQVHASSPELTGSYAGEIAELGGIPQITPLQRTKVTIFEDLAYYRAVCRLIKRTGADFVLNYTIKPNIWGSLAAWRCGVPSASMVTGLGFAFIEGSGLKRAITQRIARGLYRLATGANRCVVFQNPDDVADFVRERCLADPHKAVIVNGSGVDLTQYVPVPLPEAPVFLSTARLLRSKGLVEYAEAAAEVRKRYPQARFLLAGMLDTGPDAISRQQLNRWIAGGIEYLGLLHDVRPAIAEASVFVLPSWREGTPRAVLEAMAMGRPIITTDAPGCRETTRSGENGLLVPVRDSAALAEAMASLAGDSRRRQAMGKASRAVAEEKYSVTNVNRDLIEKLGL
jgi:glycosyltransferase involved in cell wall biosynthesis